MTDEQLKNHNASIAAIQYGGYRGELKYRDQLAMAALTGAISCGEGWPMDTDWPEIARRCYLAADAMLMEATK